MRKILISGRIFACVLIASMLMTFAPGTAFATSADDMDIEEKSENTLSYDSTTTAYMLSDSSSVNNRQLVIESYLTNKDTTDVDIRPCDIIFVVDQSKWMNTEDDAGAQRAAIISAMNNLLNNLAAPTTGGEHRIAIAGYGRVNLGVVDKYDASVYPGIATGTSNISFNTGYYTTSGFVSSNGWSDVSNSNMASSELPQMPAAYSAAMTYDSTFMTIDEAQSVLNPSTMRAWYSGASRMDAGLTIAEQLASLANENNTDGDRNLVVCIMASSLPIQNTFVYNSNVVRSDAVLAAAEKLKSQGATIFAFGDYHASGKTVSNGIDDTEANFNAVMQSVCSDPGNFYSLNSYANVTQAMNDLMTNITITSAGEANEEFTITADEFEVIESATSGTSDVNRIISWDYIVDYFGDSSAELINTAVAKVEFFNFTGYDSNNEPTFESSSRISYEVPVKNMLSSNGIAYTTDMIPLPSTNYRISDTDQADAIYDPDNYFGYKVVITISEPITITYKWASDAENYTPSNVILPDPEIVAAGTAHAAADVHTTDGKSDEHYVFNGWYLDEECTIKYTGAITPAYDFTLYGKWTKYVLVDYYWDVWSGFETADDSERIEYDNCPDTYEPEVDNYVFEGWYLDPDYNEAYTTTRLTEDLKLYAKWTPSTKDVIAVKASYMVQYYKENIDGSYELFDTDFPLYGELDTTVYAELKSLNNYYLNYDKSIISGVVITPTVSQSGNVNMLALSLYYDLNRVKVTYYLDEIENEDDYYNRETVRHGTEISVIDDPEREGYTFLGWELQEETEPVYAVSNDEEYLFKSGDTLSVVKDTVFVAQWERKVVATPEPSIEPTTEPTAAPTAEPTTEPTVAPTAEPTTEPTAAPTAEPTTEPTATPTAEPTTEPTAAPTAEPTTEPTAAPTVEPTTEPTAAPTAEPTTEPTAAPTAEPTTEPTVAPTAVPTVEPTAIPTAEPTTEPTAEPTATPTETPVATATASPTATPIPVYGGTSSSGPKTGDTGNLALWAGLLLYSGLALAGIVFTVKNKKQSR